MAKKKAKNQKKNDKHLKALIKSEAKHNMELKTYYYQPVANGTVNTSGLKYFLNAMPYSTATVTTGGTVIDQTPGVRGLGPQQVLGKEYLVKILKVQCQISTTSDTAQLVRILIVREESPEGSLFATGANSLLYDIGAGLGSLSPVMESNLLKKDGTGRFKVYHDSVHKLQNTIFAAPDILQFKFKKVFRNPVRVVTYDNIGAFTAGTVNAIANIQNNAFFMVILGNTTGIQVNQVYGGINFLDN